MRIASVRHEPDMLHLAQAFTLGVFFGVSSCTAALIIARHLRSDPPVESAIVNGVLSIVSPFGENLNIDVTVDGSVCGICKLAPRGPQLNLGLLVGGEPFTAMVCRDCLSEFAPEMLADLEGVA